MVSVFDRRVLFSGAVRYTDDEAIKQQSHQLQTTDIKDFLNGSRLKSDIVLVCLSHRWNMASWQLSNNLGRLRCAMDALKAAHQSADDSSNAVEDNEACLESSLAEQLKQLMSNKLKSLQVDFVIIEQDESVSGI
jgi:hypothetical protein